METNSANKLSRGLLLSGITGCVIRILLVLAEGKLMHPVSAALSISSLTLLVISLVGVGILFRRHTRGLSFAPLLLIAAENIFSTVVPLALLNSSQGIGSNMTLSYDLASICGKFLVPSLLLVALSLNQNCFSNILMIAGLGLVVLDTVLFRLNQNGIYFINNWAFQMLSLGNIILLIFGFIQIFNEESKTRKC